VLALIFNLEEIGPRSLRDLLSAFVHEEIGLNKCSFQRNSAPLSDIAASRSGHLFKTQGGSQPHNARARFPPQIVPPYRLSSNPTEFTRLAYPKPKGALFY
jgi:hypothetical protein